MLVALDATPSLWDGVEPASSPLSPTSSSCTPRMHAPPAARTTWGHEHVCCLCACAAAESRVQCGQSTMQSPSTIAPTPEAPTSRSHRAGKVSDRVPLRAPRGNVPPLACFSPGEVFACVCFRSWVGCRLDATTAPTTATLSKCTPPTNAVAATPKHGVDSSWCPPATHHSRNSSRLSLLLHPCSDVRPAASTS